MKYSVNKEIHPESIKKWKEFANKFNPEDLYIGGVCGLYYSLDIVDFIGKKEAEDFVSVFFLCDSIGNDKRQLLITGNKLITDEQVKSLPFNYIPNKSSQFNKAAIENQLRNVDEDLQIKKKNITLVLNIPEEFLDGLIFSNINIVCLKDLDFVMTNIDQLTNCLKVHYRKLQITKNTMHAQNSNNVTFTEYLYMISMAWNSVPFSYIRKLFHHIEGGVNSNESKELSLAHWSKINNVPINHELFDSLDEYISCDKTIRVFNLASITELGNNINVPLIGTDTDSVSVIEAYQAMKRLVNFLQGKKVDATIMKPARCLENHLEYEALVEMHEYVKGQNENTIMEN